MLVACPVANKPKSNDLCNAFIEGAPRSTTGYVFYGANQTNIDQWRKANTKGQTFWYIDNSYFDAVRGQQYRVTRNAIQVQGAKRRVSDGKRFAALGVEIKPWKPDGDYWLACAQSPTFMRDIARDERWIERTSFGSWPLRIRPWLRDKLKQQATLVDDLKGAGLLVTHSSAAAVTALLEGTPVMVSEMSAVHGIRYGDDRLPLMQVLADNQFTVTEMKTGKAWSQLNRQ